MDDVGSPSGRPSGLGGGRGKYACIDGDLPGAAEYLKAARTDVQEESEIRQLGSHKELADTNILHINIQGLRSHRAELCAALRIEKPTPDIVCINESFLDEGTEELEIEGYRLVGQRDRSYSGDKRRCGGIIMYAREAIADHVTLMSISSTAERMWVLMHTSLGPYLLCSWYRPPVQGEVQSINDFDAEYKQLQGCALGFILLGDLNLHSKRWLRFSSGNTAEGEKMREVCLEYRFRQLVKEPTRGEHLLDVCISNIESASVKVGGKIADHASVIAKLNLAIPESRAMYRTVWSFRDANWDELKKDLMEEDWTFLEHCGPSEAAEGMTRRILAAAEKHIPKRRIRTQKRSHPWLTDEIVKLVANKRAAEGTLRYEEAVMTCSQHIMAQYARYTNTCKQKLLDARRGSKLWWTTSRELLSQRARVQGIPALKETDGSWRYDAKGKADLLAESLRDKSTLPEKVSNEYSPVERCLVNQRTPKEIPVKLALSILSDLDEHSGTGPDLLPSRILKECCEQLAAPLQRLATLILSAGVWPTCWRTHWVVPLHKRGPVYLTKNYRGIHLTSQLSKAVERLILYLLTPHVSLWSLSGRNQFAYTKKRGSRDVLALLTMRWLKALDSGLKILVYCSDVSGAFDRVCKTRLIVKLKAEGFHAKLVDLISSWLDSREAYVVVGGEKSAASTIQDMVFQGTVLGPQLWNLFFADAADAIREVMFTEMVYADDLNAYKIVPGSISAEHGIKTMELAQAELHGWGDANQVSFDDTKESKHILSRTDPHGADFKLLGVIFDCRLQMDVAISTLVGKMRWKTTMLLRSRCSFCTGDLITQYKQQVLSMVEYRTSAVYHATTTLIRRLDRAQDSFLRQLNLDRVIALLEFNLAPLAMRRDISMLGILHRAAIGEGPTQFREYFYRKPGSRNLFDALDGTNPSRLMRRSIWGLVKVYNGLGGARDCDSVKDFQMVVQERAKSVVCKRLLPAWETLYSPRPDP